jgi:hypothetical protein
MATSKTERLSHYAIIFIAISALVISIWQVRISQTHNRLTVLPRMNLDPATASKEIGQEFSLTLSNHGFGPAIIKVFEIRVDGEIQPNWNAVVTKLEMEGYMTQATNLPIDQVIAAGSEQILLGLVDYNSQDRVYLKITYQSIYEDEDTVEITF